MCSQSGELLQEGIACDAGPVWRTVEKGFFCDTEPVWIIAAG